MSSTGGCQPTGSILWMAPEVIRMTPPSPYSFQSDVYSFGVVVFELASGQLPYKSLSKDAILFMVGSGLLRPDPGLVSPQTPKPLVRLMVECTQFELSKRPLFRQILASLEDLLQAQPNIQRSVSEPVSLNRFSKSSFPLLPGAASSSESVESESESNSLEGSTESLHHLHNVSYVTELV
jgi:RAF proto-oncogene serine/threonine-protein kinase